MSLDQDLIAAIDARILAAFKQQSAMGTVASIIGQTDALVTFDGSAMAVPVKMGGTVEATENDRVVMIKVGRWWVVIDTLTRRWVPNSGTSVQQSVGTTTSATYADLPTDVSVTFVKQWAETRVLVMITGAGFSTAINTEVFYGVNFSSVAQPSIATSDILSIFWNTASEHLKETDWRYLTGLAADTYTVKVQWLRNSGAGTVSLDVKDRIAIQVLEVSPT